MSFCCRPVAWLNATRSAAVSVPLARALAKIASCSDMSSWVLTAEIRPRPWSTGLASEMLAASACSTAPWPAMTLV